MRLLLTSNGISNKSIKNALADLLQKPFSESSVAFIPTAANMDESNKSWLVDDMVNIKDLGFKFLDIVDFSALPKKIWLQRIKKCDVLFFSGGSTPHLMSSLKKSGLAQLLPKLLETKVYVGVSAGSIATNPSIVLTSNDKKVYYEKWTKYKSNEGLGLIDFYVRPHLNSRFFPNANAEYIGKIAKDIKGKVYALDDQSAIKVEGDKLTVISEGQYLTFN